WQVNQFGRFVTLEKNRPIDLLNIHRLARLQEEGRTGSDPSNPDNSPTRSLRHAMVPSRFETSFSEACHRPRQSRLAPVVSGSGASDLVIAIPCWFHPAMGRGGVPCGSTDSSLAAGAAIPLPEPAGPERTRGDARGPRLSGWKRATCQQAQASYSWS